MSTKFFLTPVDMTTDLTLSSLTGSRVLQLSAGGLVEVSATTSTELGHLSGVTSAIQTQIDDKMALISTPTQNRALTVNASGQAIESGVTIDGSNNVTIPGDLTVNGTTTTINTSTLDVADANITVNDGGTQASADSADAGITVEMSDATDAFIGYDSTTTSKFLVGEVGSGAEIASISHTQTLTNKTIDGTSASGSNTVTTDADQVTYERVDGSKKNIQAGSDEAEAALTDLDDAIGSMSQGSNYTAASVGIVASHLAAIDTALSGVNSDEQIKVSANDTTAKYLEDAIVVSSGSNTTNILELSTLNDGADEDLQIQIDESKISHDNLLGFVGNEHIDHTSVTLTAGSGLSGGGDISASRTFDLDFNELTAAGIAAADEMAFADADDSSNMKKITFSSLESTLNHDSLAGYVADEHVAHSGVSVVAGGDDGLSASNNDLSSNIGLSVDISGTTAETSPEGADLILIHDDSAGALRSMSRSNFLGASAASAGDISETSFSAANNQVAAANVTGLAFANGTVRSFHAQVSVAIDATADLFQVFTLEGVQKGASWDMSQSATGDLANITFSITAAGQIQYTSGNEAGFVSSTMKFRAQTTSV